MYCFQTDITFQEVPNEISLVLSISGCPHRCHGCHSTHLWKKDNGEELTFQVFDKLLLKYKQFITCICFFGGEWDQKSLALFLSYAQSKGLKTCLYTGANEVSKEIANHLNYLKLGPWIESLGGLDNPNTNQIFMDLDSGKTLNHLFQTTTHGGI